MTPSNLNWSAAFWQDPAQRAEPMNANCGMKLEPWPI
jgi:hypothetical protein